MKTTIQELKDRIAALEAEIVRLKAQPKQDIHYHYHQPAIYSPPNYLPPPLPTYPSPFLPMGPTWICGGGPNDNAIVGAGGLATKL